MSNDKPLTQILIGRWGSAITGIASILMVAFGIDMSPDDTKAATDAGVAVINSGQAFYAAGLALASVIQALISRYKKR